MTEMDPRLDQIANQLGRQTTPPHGDKHDHPRVTVARLHRGARPIRATIPHPRPWRGLTPEPRGYAAAGRLERYRNPVW